MLNQFASPDLQIVNDEKVSFTMEIYYLHGFTKKHQK